MSGLRIKMQLNKRRNRECQKKRKYSHFILDLAGFRHHDTGAWTWVCADDRKFAGLRMSSRRHSMIRVMADEGHFQPSTEICNHVPRTG